MRIARKDAGVSLLGFIFIAAVLVIFTMVGFRMTPAYIEYYSVQKALARSLVEARDVNSPVEIRRSFQQFADAGYIESVSAKDVEVSKIGNEVVATASWTRTLHMFGNVSLFLEFDATASR